jgi:hypothetical protein
VIFVFASLPDPDPHPEPLVTSTYPDADPAPDPFLSHNSVEQTGIVVAN